MTILKIVGSEVYDKDDSFLLAEYLGNDLDDQLYMTQAGMFFNVSDPTDEDSRIHVLTRQQAIAWVEGKTLRVTKKFKEVFQESIEKKEYLTAYVYYKDTLEVFAIITALTKDKLVQFYECGLKYEGTDYTHTPFFGVPGGLQPLRYEAISLHNLDSDL